MRNIRCLHIVFILVVLSILLVGNAQGRVLLDRGGWRFVDATPANLAAAGVMTIEILPYVGGANNDDYQVSKGSQSLNSVNSENWNKDQMTILIPEIVLNFVPGDGVLHTLCQNTGTSTSQNMIQFDITGTGNLRFTVWDKDGTSHRLLYDITGWTVGSKHQVAAIIDFKNDRIEMYIDGAVVDDTPTNPLSDDSMDAIEANTHLGSDTSAANQLNGKYIIQVFSRAWSAAEVAADYDSGDGTAPVVDETTLILPEFALGTSGTKNIYTSAGKSGTTTDTDFTTDIGVIGNDGNAIRISDATSYSVEGFIDGTPSGDNIPHDDGGGSPISGVGEVGVSMFCDGTYFAQGGDILDITTEDFEIDFWMKQDGDPALAYVFGKKNSFSGGDGYQIYFSASGVLNFRAEDSANDAFISLDVSAYLDNKWHHYYCFFDRSNIATWTLFVDGIATSPSTTGTSPVLTLTNAIAFTIGARNTASNFHEGYLRDVTIHIGGTMRSEAQILYRATHPLDYSASGWTLDGTREAWKFTENTGTTNTAEVTTPGNDLTLSSAAAWDQLASLSLNRWNDGSMENGGIGAIGSIDATWTVSKVASEISDERMLSLINVAGDDNDEVEICAVTSANGEDLSVSVDILTGAIHPDAKLWLDIDGGATPITSREIGKSLGDRGNFARTFDLSSGIDLQAANNTILDAELEDIGFWAWVKMNVGGTGFQRILDKRATEGYVFEISGAGVVNVFLQDGDSDTYTLLGVTDIRDGVWHHVAGIIDRNDAANCEVYLDGNVDTDVKLGTIGDIGTLTNTAILNVGDPTTLDGEIAEAGIAIVADIMAANEMGAAGEIANLYNNPSDRSAWPNREDSWLCDDNAASTTVVGEVNNLIANANTDAFATLNVKHYEFTLEADQAALEVSLRISGEPEMVSDTFTINNGDGAISSGSLSDTYTQNGVDFVLDEVVGTPGFDFEFDFPVNGVGKSINLYGFYDGNLGHTVDVNAWDGGAWDTLGQLPDAVADTLYSFTLSATHTNAGEVIIQLDHTSAGNMNHDVNIDHLYVIDSIDATVYIDNGVIRNDLVDNPSLEGVYVDQSGGGVGTINVAPGWDNDSVETDGTDELSKEATIIHSGGASQKAVILGSGEGIQQTITVIVDKYYTVSGWINVTSGEAGMFLVNASGTIDKRNDIIAGTGWNLQQHTFRATTTTLGLKFLCSGAGTHTFYVDDVVLTGPLDVADANATKGDGLIPLKHAFSPVEWQ